MQLLRLLGGQTPWLLPKQTAQRPLTNRLENADRPR